MAGVQKIQHQYGQSSEIKDGDIKAKWWRLEEKDIHASVFPIVERIRTFQAYKSQNNLLYARLYSNLELMALRPGQYGRTSQIEHAQHNRVTLNVIKSCIDTACSKIGTTKTRPIFLTQGGDWNKKQRAKKLTKFMDGWFDYAKSYLKGQLMFRDGSVFGTGALKMYTTEEAEVKLERVIADELVVDDAEGMYGEPRQMHQIKSFHKDVLAEQFPKFVEFIQTATSPIDKNITNEVSGDMVEVVESWHLPSGKESGDGRHAISINNQTLFAEEWTKDYFPFIFFRWDDALLGFFGKGLAEQLIGIQIEINKILMNIQKAQHLVAVPQVWMDYAGKEIPQQLNNQIGGIRYYLGQPPSFFVPQAMSPEIYQHLERLYQKAYEITGISMMSANSTKPAGVTANVALRTLQDVESERFRMIVDRYEDAFMTMADMAVDMMCDLVEGGKNPEVKVKAGKGFIESIDWRQVRMSKNDYIMRKYPTSALPNSPAGRIETVQEWLQAGMISQDDAMELLDFPDTEKYISIKTAAKQVNEMLIDGMLDTGDYTPPEPEMNLQLAKTMAQNAYLKARIEGAPDERLELLRTFMDDCQTMIDQAMGQQNPQAMAQMSEQTMPQAPLGVPEQPPVSDLLPIQA